MAAIVDSACEASLVITVCRWISGYCCCVVGNFFQCQIVESRSACSVAQALQPVHTTEGVLVPSIQPTSIEKRGGFVEKTTYINH
jgi:hypothetical protein